MSLAHFALVFNAFVWGVSWLPYKWLESQGLSILWATALAYILATAALALARPKAFAIVLGIGAMRATNSQPSEGGRAGLSLAQGLWVMGLFYGLTNTCFNWALALGDVVRVVLLFYLMPVWSAIFARLILKERLSGEGLARLVLALAGAVVVLGWDGLQIRDAAQVNSPQSSISFWGKQLLADLLSIAGGLFFGLANVYLRKFESATAYERTLTMYLGSGVVPLGVLGLMALINLVVFQNSMQFPSLSSPLQAAPQAWFVVPLLALGLGLANYSLQYGGSRLATQVTSLIMLSEIVFAAVSAAWFAGKILTTAEWIGGGMIVLAAIWASLRPPSAPKTT
jgi:drug/metabolite transporter (DMT)-like permease